MISQYFTYNDKKYSFNVLVGDFESGRNVVLRSQNVGLFQYSNEMNSLTLEGTLEYTDTDTYLDQFLDKQYVFCTVQFKVVEQQTEGQIHLDKVMYGEDVATTFFVDNFEILDNSPGNIRYKLHLKGSNWQNLKKSVSKSNYGEKKKIFEIIKEILTGVGEPVDVEAFDNLVTNAEIEYITHTNDDVISCIRYLMDKYYKSKIYGIDESLKALVYDEVNDKIEPFDSVKTFSYQKSIEIILDQIKNTQSLMNNDPVRIGYLLKKNRSEAIMSTHPLTIKYYDITTNKFTDEVIESKTKNNVIVGQNNVNPRIRGVQDDSTFAKVSPFWNNDINMANDMFTTLTQYNSLIVNTEGYPGVVPGYIVSIGVPKKE